MFLRTEIHRASEVSIADDSSWRELDPEVVAELCGQVESGSYGQTSLAPPTLVGDGDRIKLSAVDGGLCLYNGKQWTAVMRDKEKAVSEMSEEDILSCTWLTAPLLEGLRNGFRYDVYEFPGPYDRLRHVVYQTFSHEAHQNQLCTTTLQQRASIALRFFEREGRDWTKAIQAMVLVLGKNKNSTIQRWRVIARDLSAEVLAHAKSQRNLPMNFIVGNKYLVGKGSEANCKIGDVWAKIAFDWHRDKAAGGPPFPKQVFEEDFCRVAKHGESWERAQKKIFGVTATGFKAFERIVANLKTESGRKAILAWLRNPDLRKQPHFGLEDAAAVIREMEKMKAGTNPSLPGNGKTAPEGEGAEAGQAALMMGPDGEAMPEAPADANLFFDLETSASPEPENPLLAQARCLADKELLLVTIYVGQGAFQEFSADVQGHVYPTSKPIVYLECPTSRAATFHEFLKLVPWPTQFSLYMPLGSRMDVASTLMEILKKQFPARPAFLIVMSTGKQSRRVKPSFALYMPMDINEEIPTFISLKGCRASSSEGLRLRCLDYDCAHRPSKPAEKQPKSEKEEIEAEDLEGGSDFEECFEGGENSGDEKDAEELDATEQKDDESKPKEPGQEYTVNLFCYGAPIAVHGCVFRDLLKGSQRTHLLLLSRTAHPGLIVAAREANLKVIGWRAGVSAHSASHGEALLKKLLTQRKLKDAKRLLAETAAPKRLRAADFQFIVAAAPPPQEQVLHVLEVETAAASAWRAGLNMNPENLSEKIVRQLQVELDSSRAMLHQASGGKEHLVAGKAHKEGDVVCSMAGLTFDSKAKLKEFLHAGDVNKCLSSNMCQINGLVMSDEQPPKLGSLFRVFTGLGRFVRPYGALKKSPNVALVVNPGEGVNDGLVTLVVRTKNKGGVARGTPLVLNYGMEFDHDLADSMATSGSPETKRFRGLLAQYFTKLGPEELDKEANGGVPEVDEKMKSPRKQLFPGDDKKGKEEEDQKGKDNEKKRKEEQDKKSKEDERKRKEAEDKKNQGEKRKKEEDKKQGEKRKKEEEDKKSKEDERKKEDEDKKNQGGKEAETMIAEISSPCAMELRFSGPRLPEFAGSAILVAKGKLEGNKKIPPQCILCRESAGTIKASHATGVQFAIANPKKVLVCETNGPVMTMHQYLEQHGATSVARHSPATFKNPPPALTPDEKMLYLADEPQKALFLEFVRDLADVGVGWVVKTKDAVVRPTGLFLYNVKQLIMPAAGGRLALK